MYTNTLLILLGLDRKKAVQQGAAAYATLKTCHLTGCVNEKCKEYTEFGIDLIRLQLEMFHRSFAYSSVYDKANVMRCYVPEVRTLFNQVEIVLVISVTSCEADRSYSSLRRLKLWLRSTMMQERLNNVAVCNVHHEYV